LYSLLQFNKKSFFSSNKLEKSWRIKPDFSPQTDGSPQNLSFSPKTPNSNIKTPRRNTSLTPKALQTPPTPTTIAPFAIESNFKYSTNFLMSFQQHCTEIPEGIIPEIRRSSLLSPSKVLFDPNLSFDEDPFEDEEDNEDYFEGDECESEDEEPVITFTPERINCLPKPDLSVLNSPRGLVVKPRETDQYRLKARQKQLDIGKNTEGYQSYLEMVPREKRQKGDPRTPNKNQVCSKRSWDGQVRKWRRQLHFYDPPEIQFQDAEKEINYESSYESVNTPYFYLCITTQE